MGQVLYSRPSCYVVTVQEFEFGALIPRASFFIFMTPRLCAVLSWATTMFLVGWQRAIKMNYALGIVDNNT